MGINDISLDYQAKMKATIPAGRFCELDEIYKLIKCLIEVEYINSAAIDINGALK
jgi:hypothetical protein